MLLEGVPGLGKTLLVRALAHATGLRFSRIQFTPDLMPADIVGTDIISEADGRRQFQFSPGPIFANVVLADEVNRATPKTQSALLEAMEERTVTVGTHTYALEEPYVVLATENPIEMEGTYPLPEAQLDRFMLKAVVTFPDLDQLVEIVTRTPKAKASGFRGRTLRLRTSCLRARLLARFRSPTPCAPTSAASCRPHTRRAFSPRRPYATSSATARARAQQSH